MRSVASMVWLLALIFLAGCGNGGKSTPKSVTEDEQRQMDDAEAKATAEESARPKSTK